MSSYCGACRLPFKSLKGYQNHFQRFHQTTVIHCEGGETLTVKAGEDGTFLCHCGCSLANARTFKRHLTSSCRASRVSSVQLPDDDHEDLRSTDPLETHGLVVNVRYGLLICRDCGLAINKFTPIHHMRTHKMNMSFEENDVCVAEMAKLVDIENSNNFYWI